MTFVTAGSDTSTATDASDGTITGFAIVNVTAAAANHYSLSAPLSSTAGSPFTITLTAFDPYNNVATGYLGKAQFSKTDAGTGSLVPADYTFVAADAGAHTFANG